jgi:hypothetical protein
LGFERSSDRHGQSGPTSPTRTDADLSVAGLAAGGFGSNAWMSELARYAGSRASAREETVTHFGLLGRSEGCLAVSNSSLDVVLARLGPGRLIYAGKAWR